MLSFSDLTFKDMKESIRVSLYGYFYKDFTRVELEEVIGEIVIKKEKLIVSPHLEKKFMQYFRKFKKDLVFAISGKKAVFVDEDTELPLIGLNFLGIVDKGSEMVEIKPITNCNLDCTFCSVNEGPSSKKEVDFVVDKDYLYNQIVEFLAFKQEAMSLWFNPHGEPLLYSELFDMVAQLVEHQFVKEIVIVTNGVLLDKVTVDAYARLQKECDKKIKISFSFSEMSDKGLMGKQYALKQVLGNLEYVARKLDVTLTPVWIKGKNDDDIEKIVRLAQELRVKIGIQKFCANKKGRNPIKETTWEAFFNDLKVLERKTGVVLSKPLGKIKETKTLPVICKKGEVIPVRVVCCGRFFKDKLGVFESGN